MATKEQLIASAQKNLEKGQIKKAIKDYQELLKLDPKVDQHKQKLADLLYRDNFKDDALVLYDSLAKGYAERGFSAKAVAVYKQMQRIDPANPDNYLRLAEMNRSLGLLGNAMSEYRSLLELCENRKMVAETANVLQKMVELEPENIGLQLRVLQNFLKEKLYEKAKETILSACEVCAKSGDSDKSQKILQTILSHLPENVEFHTELANKLSAAGLFTDAIFIFLSLTKRSPQDPLILNELATLYNKTADAENEIRIIAQLSALQPTVATIERLVRLCLLTGDYGRALSELEEHEALLDNESHTLLLGLYQELERLLPGDQRVRSAIARLCGGQPLPPIVTEEALPPAEDLTPTERVEDFSFGDEEFGLDDLLSLRPRSSEVVPLPSEEPLQEEQPAEEELADVSIELPLEEIPFDDIDTFTEELADVTLEIPVEALSVEDLDILEELAEPPLPAAISQEEVAPSLINIDFDFSQFDEDEAGAEAAAEIGADVEADVEVDVEVEAEVEIEDEIIDVLEVDLAVEDNIDRFESTPVLDLQQRTGALDTEFLTEKEPAAANRLEDETTLTLSEIDYDFAGEAEIKAAEGIEAENDRDVIEEIELLEDVDDEEILELEPLEEEDDLGAELAALEDLLDAEMEDASLAGHSVFNVAADEVESNAPRVDDDFFDLAAEILDDGALQATEGLANVDENDRFRFDSVFSEFKKGVDAQIDHEDTEAHYDLGIAYKEMGLMDDAIEEFKKSMRSLKRLADSLILIGICYAEKGAFADAEAVFSTAIARPEVQEADKIGTQYELGLVYEVWGRPADALRTFEAVAHSDPSFRNVEEKIEALRLLVDVEQGEAVSDTPGSVSPGKNRVSFV